MVSPDDLFPALKKSLRKGDCGKIGVIGGSPEYTGAPFFAAITPVRLGADLSFVYAHPAAAPAIKGYSPELIVYPSYDFSAIRPSLDKLDSLVFGPGLGRDGHSLALLHSLLQFIVDAPNVCLVIDGDGLLYISDSVHQLKNCPGNVIITPNNTEFADLFTKLFPDQSVNEEDEARMEEHTRRMAHRLGVVVFRKGKHDLISDGDKVVKGDAKTSKRRCAGQGDILSGAIAVFCHWSRRKGQRAHYSQANLMEGALAASQFVRRLALMTYRVRGGGGGRKNRQQRGSTSASEVKGNEKNINRRSFAFF